MTNILEVKHISKYIANKMIVDDININIKSKEIVGFIGPNGAGKSSTLKLISTLWHANNGQIYICGYNTKNNREQALNCITATIEQPMLYQDLTGQENITIVAKLRNIDKARVTKIMSMTGLQKDLKKKVKTYSMGMKQRLMLGLCLLPNPRLMLLDEPTNGLDPNGVKAFYDILKEQVKTEDIAILISSHQLHELSDICTRFIFIKNGRLIPTDEKPPNETYQLKVSDPNKLVLLINTKYEQSVCADSDNVKIKTNETLNINTIVNLCMTNEIKINQIYRIQPSIIDQYEEFYL
ncbi:MAG: ABC transporter ATP-binding protein [Erysipelotrichaceae bacterium]|nr:ABC transporter ATP-binding protein [Erysipelotrichaceae bacterium]